MKRDDEKAVRGWDGVTLFSNVGACVFCKDSEAVSGREAWARSSWRFREELTGSHSNKRGESNKDKTRSKRLPGVVRIEQLTGF